MKRRYREEPEEEKEPPVVTYGRPTSSSWVAAVAVAFAFFMLGGFIKTYLQLEDLRAESRREIDDLHESVRRLEEETLPVERPRQAPAYRVQPLPPARRERREYWQEPAPPREPIREPIREPVREPLREPAEQRASLRPEGATRQLQYAAPEQYAAPDQYAAPNQYAAPQEYRRYDNPPPQLFEEYPDEAEPARPRVQFGRRSEAPSRQIIAGSGTPSQVVSVSGANKRLMIEGGRDVGISEGLRLELCRDGRWIGDLRVLDVFDNQSSCEVLHATLDPLPGDSVRRAQR